MSDPHETINLTITRSGRDAGPAEYTIPSPGPYSRVLDLLVHVQRHVDPTLSFRYACRVGMCGACAMVINGKEALACQVTVGSLGNDVRLEPLRALPVQRDLSVDMAPFFANLKKANAAFAPSEPQRTSIRTIPPGGKDRVAIEAQNGCVTCGACYSACDCDKETDSYLGHAALNRILMLSMDERDALGKQRLAAVVADRSVVHRHAHGGCPIHCPADIPLRDGQRRLEQLANANENAG
jgi:fumarate reductase iron-sulfur subunit